MRFRREDVPVPNGRSPLVTKWRMVGWILAAVAVVVVAGPQILALFVP